jgi:hypothetical protein
MDRTLKGEKIFPLIGKNLLAFFYTAKIYQFV